jgi:hypothetical protein
LLSTFFKYLAEKGVLTSKHFEAGFMDVLEFVEDLVLYCEHKNMCVCACVSSIPDPLKVHSPLLCLCKHLYLISLQSTPFLKPVLSLCVCVCVRAPFFECF